MLGLKLIHVGKRGPWSSQRCLLRNDHMHNIPAGTHVMGSWHPLSHNKLTHWYTSTHWDPSTNRCVSELGLHGVRLWLVAGKTPRHYLNQCWLVVNWILMDLSINSVKRHKKYLKMASAPLCIRVIFAVSFTALSIVEWFLVLELYVP